MVFVSAGVNKGAEWLHTPDYRKGDRNGQQLLPKYPLRIGSTYIIKEQGFTAPEDFDPYPRANVHRQRPGNGPRGDAIFDAFTAANFPISSSNANVENTMRMSRCQLLSMIGQSYTVCHSSGCAYTATWVGRTAARPCGLTYTSLQYDPPATDCSTITQVSPLRLDYLDDPAKRSCMLQTVTIHMLTHLSKHMGLTNHQRIKHADVGIKDNAHFMFLEKNNQGIAAATKNSLGSAHLSGSSSDSLHGAGTRLNVG
ncbi:hypothetical protein PMIN02_004951 [Paraphaeosphaeria minitans]|uniref:Uncharacterized protein n=1 Tax=Paraphaeosphaeria minitans TaxID=565426 RepID=A0A9P6KPV9_9PLEO|nr:hypothetical protein PMIN01_07385 [Paraphaeosphaeria minitans]